MHENLANNLRMWDESYAWPQDGDEWQGQAALCGVPYAEWKASLVEHLIDPYVTARTAVLEIAPGRGRWTEYLVRRAAHVTLVDLSPACLAYCRERFRAFANVDYALTPGDRLPEGADGRIGVVWSYDSFVHMHPDVVAAYLGEMRRVLEPGGRAIVHHANVADPRTHRQEEAPGWRSAVTGAAVRVMAAEAGLAVERQFTYWDEARRIGVPRFGDQITVLRR